jgi:hypothetical protein
MTAQAVEHLKEILPSDQGYRDMASEVMVNDGSIEDLTSLADKALERLFDGIRLARSVEAGIAERMRAAPNGARLVPLEERQADVIRVELEDPTMQEAIVAALGARLAAQFEWTRATGSIDPDSPVDVVRIGKVATDSLPDVVEGLLNLLRAKQMRVRAAADFVGSVLEGTSEAKAVGILGGRLAQISAEFEPPAPYGLVLAGARLSLVTSGGQFILPAEPVTRSFETVLTGPGSETSKLSALKQTLSDVVRALGTPNDQVSFRQRASAVIGAVRAAVTHSYDEEFAKLKDVRGDITLAIDADTWLVDPASVVRDVVQMREWRGDKGKIFLRAFVRTTQPLTDTVIEEERQKFLNAHPEASVFNGLDVVSDFVTDIAQLDAKEHAELFARPLLIVSGEKGLKASGVETRSGDHVITLQVETGSTTLNGVAKVGGILRLSSKAPFIRGLRFDEKIGVYIIRPLMAMLNTWLKQIKTERVSVGASA